FRKRAQIDGAAGTQRRERDKAGWVFGEMEIEIRVVFNNQQIVSFGDLDQLAATLGGECYPRGVLKVRDRVDALDATAVGQGSLDLLSQLTDDDTVVILPYA